MVNAIATKTSNYFYFKMPLLIYGQWKKSYHARDHLRKIKPLQSMEAETQNTTHLHTWFGERFWPKLRNKVLKEGFVDKKFFFVIVFSNVENKSPNT